jgi:hypothetical protein
MPSARLITSPFARVKLQAPPSHRIFIPHSHGCRWIGRLVIGSRSSQGIDNTLTTTWPVVSGGCTPWPGTVCGAWIVDGCTPWAGTVCGAWIVAGRPPPGDGPGWVMGVVRKSAPIEAVAGSANKPARINLLVHLCLYITRRTLFTKSSMRPTELKKNLGKPDYPRMPSVPKGVLIW